VGVDPNAAFLAAARVAAQRRGVSERREWREARMEAKAFADGAFGTPARSARRRVRHAGAGPLPSRAPVP
jgi:hypothetical protein